MLGRYVIFASSLMACSTQPQQNDSRTEGEPQVVEQGETQVVEQGEPQIAAQEATRLSVGPQQFSSSSTCTPKFSSYAGGIFGNWMGADAAYSVRLPSGKSLWFFGDTFMKFGNMANRHDSSLIGNTVAVSNCINGQFKITYNWWLTGTTFNPFFKHNIAGRRYWPAKPWLVDNRLFVPLLDVKHITTGFGFQIVGADVAIIDNPEDMPDRWRISYRALTSHNDVNMGQGVFQNANYVYLLNGVNGGTTLARIAVDKLRTDPLGITSHIEYYNKSSTWSPGYGPTLAKNIGLHAGSGLTIRWDSTRNMFLALYADFSIPMQLAKQVSVSTATTIRGPWTPPVPVFKFPELDPNRPGYNSKTNCYAAYEHPQFNPRLSTEFAFTYNCNADMDYVRSNLNIYFPTFVRVPIPNL
jgi:hypothetical protein